MMLGGAELADQLGRPFADGTVAVELDPLSLLGRLAATVPPPRFNTVRYAGVLGSAKKWRALVVPPPPDDVPPGDVPRNAPNAPACASSSRPPTDRSGWRPWQELMKRSFAAEVETCDRCGGRMNLRSLVTRPENIRRLLGHLGEPTEAPPRAPARDPPLLDRRVLRRRSYESSYGSSRPRPGATFEP